MIVVGGRSILSGAMTLGDFVMYLFFTGLVAAPLVQIASIGTQVSEAFAGLDRIREIRSMATEEQEDRARRPLAGSARRRVEFERRGVRVQPGRARPEGRLVPCAGRVDHRAGRIERLREEHAHQPGDGVQPAEDGRSARRRRATSAHIRLHDYRVEPRRRAAGELPVRRDDRREHRLRAARTRAARRSWRSAGSRTATSSSRQFPEKLRHGGRRAGREAVRRPAPAGRDRPRHPGRPANPDPGRGDVAASTARARR